MNGMEDADSALPAEFQFRRTEGPIQLFSRLAHLHEEIPLHQQHKKKVDQLPMHYGGQPSTPSQPNKRMRNLRLACLAHLDNDTKAKVSRSVQTAHVKSWLHAHGYVVKADKLHPAVTRVIEEWFQLVDQDNSRTLEHHELLAALKEAQIPCDDATISEMITLMDVNKDGVIDWEEFEVFMTEEFAAGKSLLSGEYLLPSGTSLNFGVMIGKLKRNRLLRDIMEDPSRRSRWATIANNPDALGRELATMQEAAEVTSLTLDHLKRSERSRGAGTSPHTRLTATLMRAMDEGRPVLRTAASVGNLVDKLRNGIIVQGCDMLQHGELGITPNTPGGRVASSRERSPVRTSGSACSLEPTTSPWTPNGSEGSFSVGSSLDTLMHVHFQTRRYGQGHNGVGEAMAESTAMMEAPDIPGTSTGVFGGRVLRCSANSTSSHSADAVGRCLASQHGSQGMISPRLGPQQQLQQPQRLVACSVASLGQWVEHDPRASEQHHNGSSSGIAATCHQSHPSPCTLPPPRRNDGPTTSRSGGPIGSLVPCTDSHAAQADKRCRSAKGASGAATADRDRSQSPGQASGSGGVQSRPGTSGIPSAPAPHYLAASTASSRAHVRPPSRVISQVGRMAKELRAAPGRYSVEPLGLPPAVLAATRGHWAPTTAAVASGNGSSSSSSGRAGISMDGFRSTSMPDSSSGNGGMAAACTASAAISPGPSSTRSSLLADLPPASSPSSQPQPQQRNYGTNFSTLPFLTQATHLSELLDVSFAMGDDRAETAGSSAGGASSARRASPSVVDVVSIVGERPVGVATLSLPDTPQRVPMRLMGMAAWESPVSQRSLVASAPNDAAADNEISSPCAPSNAPPGLKCQGYTVYAAASVSGAAGANVAATKQLAPQPTGFQDPGWPDTAGDDCGATITTVAASTGSKDKALKPTSIMMRVSPDFIPYADMTTATTPRQSTTSDGDGEEFGGSGSAVSKSSKVYCRASLGELQKGSSVRRVSRGSTGDGAPSATPTSPSVGHVAESHGIATSTGPGLHVLAGQPAGPAGRLWNFNNDGDGSFYGTEIQDAVENMGQIRSSGRQSQLKSTSPKSGGGGGSGSGSGSGNDTNSLRSKNGGRARASGSGNDFRAHSAATARQRREAASVAAVATALLDALPLRFSIMTHADTVSASVSDSSLMRSPSSSLPTVPVSSDGRTGSGGVSQAIDRTSGSGRAAGNSSSPGRATLAFIGPPEGRPPSRARTPLSTRGDKEDPIDAGWRAATASLLQLQLTHCLNDPEG